MILAPIPAQTPAPPRQAESAPRESEPRNFDAILEQAQKPSPDRTNAPENKSATLHEPRRNEAAAKEKSGKSAEKAVATNKPSRSGRSESHDQPVQEQAQSTSKKCEQPTADESAEPTTPDETVAEADAGQTPENPSDDATPINALGVSAESITAQVNITAAAIAPVTAANVAGSSVSSTPAETDDASASDATEIESIGSTETASGDRADSAKSSGLSAMSSSLQALAELMPTAQGKTSSTSDSTETPGNSSTLGQPNFAPTSLAASPSHEHANRAGDSASATPTANFATQLAEQMDEQQANVAQVSRGLQAAVQQNGGSVTLRLNPPEMGLVRVQMHLEAGVVRADLVAQQDSTASMLSKELGQLKHALESQGLTVDKLGVQTMSPSAPVSASKDSNCFSNTAQDDGRSRGQMQDDRRERSSQQAWNPAEELSEFDRKLLNLVA